jgi:cobalt-zinc-cadmium efflux system outer membrane protein
MLSPIRIFVGAIASVLLIFTLTARPASSQTLHVFVEAAASRSPELAGLGGRQTVIGARQSSANLWTPAPPTVSGSYLTDQALRNRQQREAQIGISTPIWLPGEGTASRRVADAEMARSAAQIIVIKLKIAGQVRDSLAEFALAKAEASLAERRLRDARALEADVRRRSGVREASDADVLLAQAERITADSELRERRVALEQSKLDFESLTGMPPAVAALREPLAPDTTNPHPRIEEAKGAVDVARANRSLAGIQTRESPEIGLIARRNRDIYGTVFDNSIGVEVRIPLSTEARNGPRQAAAQAELTEATAGFSAVEREIALEQRKARLGYDNALVQRDLAVERAKVLTRQSGLVARGFQAGQTSLFDTIRARTLAYEAEIAGSRAEIGVAKARSRLNQAVGAVP